VLYTYVMKLNRSNCPLASALDIVGDKWSLLVIRDLFLGKKTFTEFLKSPEKIATNILANRLETLSKKGVLKFTKLPNDQKTKIYYLTDKGIDMYPIIYEMINWSSRNINKEFGPKGKDLINRFENTQQEIVIADAQSAYRSERLDILAHSS